MKIVALDSYAANPGDLSWERFDAFGEFVSYDRTDAANMLERSGGAAALLTNKTLLTAEHFEQLGELKYIGVLATGYNVVDLAAARDRGICVTNVPGYSTDSVAQHVFALLLEAANAVGEHSESCRSGKWASSPDFCFVQRSLTELSGLTIGIVGYGTIGRAVAKIASAFGMNVVAASRSEFSCDIARRVALDELLKISDVVTLHCPLTNQTASLINADSLAKMKPTAILINTARGPVIDELAVAKVLAAGKLGFCCVDVLSSEPPATDNPLLSAPRAIITPHIAWATRAARKRLLDIAADNLAAFVAGEPVNVVS